MTFLWLLILLSYGIANIVSQKFTKDMLEDSHGKIIYSSILFRHGNRNPAYLFPTLEYTDKSFHEGKGQLNTDGKKLMYALGKWIGARYVDTELQNGYRYDRVRVDSSDIHRTLQSAQLVLAGLFPPQGHEIWDVDGGLKWQPIAVHTKPIETDEIIFQVAECKKYDNAQDKINESAEWGAYFKENEDFYMNIVSKADLNLEKENILPIVEEVSYVLDTIQILRSYNLKIPDWASEISQKTIDSVIVKSVYGWVPNELMQRLKTGPLLKSFINDMKEKREGKLQRFLHLYSGHDFNIGSILVAFGNYEQPCPYGAAFIVELREKEGQHYVTMQLRDKADAYPRTILLPKCGEYCTLDKFIEHTAYLIPDNWQQECDAV